MESPAKAWWLAGLAALAAPSCSERAPELPPQPRGVLLISVDSLRADHLSTYGYRSPTRPELATSPTIDARLADAGVVFEQAVSTTSWTVPAHKALLTGLPDELHGGSTLGPLPASRALLAEVLRAAGWRTGGFFSGPNLHPWYGFGRGFERYVDCSNAPVDDEGVFTLEGEAERTAMHDVQRASHQGITGPKLVEAFDAWMEGVAAEERFFAFVHMWDVHFDYAAPAEFDVFYPGYDGWVDGGNFFELEKREQRAPEDVQRLLALYDAEVRFTDHNIGLLLDRLERAGRLSDTLVVLVSDHGEEFFEHGRFGHNRTLFEEVVHVPLILRYDAGLPAGLRLRDVASLADVAPTVLELCGVRQPEGMWGRSLLPAVHARLEPRDAPLDLRLYREDDPLRGVRGPAHKLVQAQREERPSLYDLAADPREQRPLVVEDEREPHVARGLELMEGLRLLGRALGEHGDEAEMPEELLRRIHAAGYTGGGTR